MLFAILSRIFRRIVPTGHSDPHERRFFYRTEYDAFQAQRAACIRQMVP
jgi:hypothetical protein